MKKLLFSLSLLLSLPFFTHAIPIDLEFPSQNVTLTVEGAISIVKEAPLTITFTDTKQTLALTADNYLALRSVMDSIYAVTGNTTVVAPITISVPTSNIGDLKDLLQ